MGMQSREMASADNEQLPLEHRDRHRLDHHGQLVAPRKSIHFRSRHYGIRSLPSARIRCKSNED
jgi:hypothetical protein